MLNLLAIISILSSIISNSSGQFYTPQQQPNSNIFFGQYGFQQTRPQQVYYPGFQQRPAYNTNFNQQQSSNRNSQINYASNKRISAKKCEEYSKSTKNSVLVGSLSLIPNVQDFSAEQCDVSQGLVIGGENAKAGEFPHMVAIGYQELNEIKFICGGSLISERYVLTAAHCKKSGKSLFVRIGDLNLNLRDEGLPEENIPIESFIAHESYNPRNAMNDIAVIRLARNVKISKYVRPACLIQPNLILHSNKAIATGWGNTESFGGSTSDIMQKVELDLLRHDNCKKNFENYLSNIQLCAGILAGGKDTCQGDSGGPLQIRSEDNKCIHILIGVTSYGNTYCGFENSPAVYTRVSSYLDWIERQVWGSEL